MVNDGSWHQYRQLDRQGGGMSVEDALHTPGALVFTFSSDPMASRDRPTSAGVAISLGNGKVITVTPGGTVEVVDASTREFTHGAVMPGFEDARSQTPEAREQLERLLEEHGLEAPAAPEADFSDPDGDGVPMSPADARARIDELQDKAALLRDQAEQAGEYRDRRDADLEVANALLDEREADLERLNGAVARAWRQEAAAAADLQRARPNLEAAGDDVIALQHRLGIPVPSERDLLTADGDPRPAPPAPETDPATVRQLRDELAVAQARVDRLQEDNRPSQDVLDRMTAERKDAEALRTTADAAVAGQRADVAAISELRQDAEAFTAQAIAFNADSTRLSREADLLDAEAATLAAGAMEADRAADKLQAQAVVQDSLADEIDARMASGVATELHIKDDVEGIDVVIDIPGRVPTEGDLPQPGRPDVTDQAPVDRLSAPGADPQPPGDGVDLQAEIVESPTFEAPPEPEPDFAAGAPEPDMTDALFDGLGRDDDVFSA